jgi:tRNA dimethylallyltransferase
VLSEESPVIVAGGSGLHMRAVVDPLEFSPHDPGVRRRLESVPFEDVRAGLIEADPAAGDHLDLENPRRVVRAAEILELTGETPSDRASTAAARDVAAYRPLMPFTAVGIDPGEVVFDRVRARVEHMREAGLLEEVSELAPVLGRTAAQAVGYKELLPVVRGELAEEEGFSAVTDATLGLVRRQRTYFRRDPRITWVEWCEDEVDLADRVLETWEGSSRWSS